MPLSQSTLDELRGELNSLHHARAATDERIKAIEAILTPFDFGDTLARPASLPFDSNVAKAVMALAEGFGSAGLRPAILSTLKERGPMRSPDIAKVLAEEGFLNDGAKTPLATRVYNDLWRMSERKIVKNDNGVFSLFLESERG